MVHSHATDGNINPADYPPELQSDGTWGCIPVYAPDINRECGCRECQDAREAGESPQHRHGCTCPHPQCPAPGKHPKWAGWQYGERYHAETLARGGSNIGIPTGPGNGIWILDIDGEQGLADLARLEATIGQLPATYTVITGSGTGRHYYFQWPPGLTIKSVSGIDGTSIDTRGAGGQGVGPGSLHCSGGEYRLVDGCPEHAADPPQALLDWLITHGAAITPEQQAEARQNARRSKGLPTTRESTDRTIRRAQRYLAKMPLSVQGDNGSGACYRVACVLMWGFALDEEEAFTAIGSWNAQCSPPWSREELRHKFQSALTAENHEKEFGYMLVDDDADNGDAETGKTYNMTDTGNTRRLVALHGSDIRYIRRKQQWLVWTGTRWDTAPDGNILHRTEDVASAWRRDAETAYEDARQAESDALASGEDDRDRMTREATALKKRADALHAHANHCEAQRSRNAMVSLAIAEPGISAESTDLDTHPYYLNVDNGTIDLKTRELRPHDPSDMITQQASVVYDPDAVCPAYDKFISQVFRNDQEVIDCVHRYIGSMLSGDITEHIVMFFIGEGGNGKSTLLNLFNTILGDYSMKANAGLLIGKPGNADGPEPTKMTLAGKRCVMVSETAEGARLNEHLMKDLVGGEIVTGHGKYQAPWSYFPSHKLLFSSNHPPVIASTDRGTWRRILRVEFTQFFRDVDDPDYDPTKHLPVVPGLDEILLSERSGILNRWLDGFADWHAQGRRTKPPESVTKTTEEYRDDQDEIGRFVEECLDIVDMPASGGLPSFCSSRTSDVYQAYLAWAKANGRKFPYTQTRFTPALVKHGAVKGTAKGYKTFKNVYIVDDGRGQSGRY